MPVLDAPCLLQLHATIDKFSFLSDSTAASADGSHIFWLDREAVRRSLENTAAGERVDAEVAQRRKPLVDQLLADGWDLFARVLPDGSMVVRALAVGTFDFLSLHRCLVAWTAYCARFCCRTSTVDRLPCSNSLRYYIHPRSRYT